MHDDPPPFDHVGMAAEAALRKLIDQRDAYRTRVSQLEQATTEPPTVHTLLADPDVNAGVAYIRFRATNGVELLDVNPGWGAWWIADEADFQSPDFFEPAEWRPTQAQLRAHGEKVPASAYRP